MSLDAAIARLGELEQNVLRELVALSSAKELSETAFQTAAVSLRSQLRRHLALAEQLEAAATEQDRPAEQADAIAHARSHRAENATLANHLREIGTRVRASRPEREAAERTSLLVGGGGAGDQTEAADRAALSSARETTASLQRLKQMMAEELARSDTTMRTLDAQGNTLNDTQREHRGIGETLKTSKRALSRLSRRDFTDCVLLTLGFVFFMLVVLLIMKRRMGFGGTTFTPWRSVERVGAAAPPQTLTATPGDVQEPVGAIDHGEL